jgi:hypothetical protein
MTSKTRAKIRIALKAYKGRYGMNRGGTIKPSNAPHKKQRPTILRLVILECIGNIHLCFPKYRDTYSNPDGKASCTRVTVNVFS